ncbi:hypothetical protein HU200_042118 [Digitaria exilis]|uniref:Uncharacterized protein n=1 Tax=Digitaria exilis TaxID=1010633 RepID=A0A835BBN0_9POAL|nr:hypothetical protein HU200_042118 [Digitaria exilis]
MAHDLHDKIQRTKDAMLLPFFMEIFVIAVWELWNLPNGIIFEGHTATISLWTVKFKDQITRHLHRVRDDFKPIIIEWLTTIL